MNNLRQLYKMMIAAGVTSDVFPVDYNRHRFTCILIIQDYGCSLIISTLGPEPETIAIDIPTSFDAPTRLEDVEYRILARYLGFTGATGNIFIPSRFFQEFDSHITPRLNRQATLQEATRAIGRAVNIAEENKHFFCGWRQNGKSGHVSAKNYAKTRKFMGENIANQLRSANISSRWTHIEGEENLAVINDYLTMLP